MNSRNNGQDPLILRSALVGLLGAMSCYYEDKIDMPYERTKALAQKVNDKFNLNIDINSIFFEKEDEYEFDRLGKNGGCGHDQNETYYESPLDRL
jgi:hypothetical protein